MILRKTLLAVTLVPLLAAGASIGWAAEKKVTATGTDGALFWFDSQKISAAGHTFYGAYAYEQTLPLFAPRTRSGSYAFFDGDFLPQHPIQVPHHTADEKKLAEDVLRMGGRAYAIAVFGYQKTDFAAVDAALRKSKAAGYMGMTSVPNVGLDTFIALRGSMSLVVAMRIDGAKLKRADFDLLSDEALRKMGFEPSR
jgi:hypothetical protein